MCSYSLQVRLKIRCHAPLVLLPWLVVLPGCVTPQPAERRPPPVAPTRPPTVVAPPSSVVEVGRSHAGTPIVLEIIGDGPARILILGGIHGNEPTSATVAVALAEHLRHRPDLWEVATVGILAEANPDGLARRSRWNARGVDLNRNFPARNWRVGRGERAGGTPGSEPETQAVLAAVARLEPQRIVSLHSIVGGRECNNYDGPAVGLARRMSRLNGYPPAASIGYPTPGSFGTWAGVDRGIPTVTLELPRAATHEEVWPANRDALIAFIRGEEEEA